MTGMELIELGILLVLSFMALSFIGCLIGGEDDHMDR